MRAWPSRSTSGSASITQLIIGLVALPLSALPFVAYGTFTPEGRLVRDRVLVALRPPTLPVLTTAQRTAARAAAPSYDGGVVALAYHGIGSASDAEGGFVVSPTRFAEHLAYLRAAGMQAVTAHDVALAFGGRGPALPPNAVMLSFDDGRTDAMLFADGLLDQAGMEATMFVIADAADRPGVYYASWDKIESYAASGRWDIQSHTAGSHTDQKADGGRRLPALTSRASGESLDEYRERVRADLERGSSEIEEHVGRRPLAFAYPFGAYGSDRTNDPAIGGILREEVARHHVVAFHQDDQHSIPLLTPTHDFLGLRRLEVGNWSGPQLLGRLARAASDSPASGAGAGGLAGDDDIPVIDFPPLPSDLGATPAPAELPTGRLISSPPRAPAGSGAASESSASAGSGSAAPAPGATVPPPAMAPPTTAGPPVTSPPDITRPPVTTAPPTTVRPPATTPPTTAAPPPACNLPPNGKGPKTCPPGRSG
jgi:peptidoglycan/xylan/chitin deacetylase (PgdA/CDA1 family)